MIVKKDIITNNLNYTIALGSHLFLHPVNVIVISNFILGSYCNDQGNNNSLKWFDEMITNILTNPVQFKISGYFGMATNYSKKEKAVLFIKLFGNTLSEVSLEQFLKYSIPRIHEFIQYLIRPENKCFLQINNEGLKGNFFFEFFQYNHLLNDLFEPSFIIITLYRRYIELTIPIFKGEESPTINEIRNLSHILDHFLMNQKLEPSFSEEKKIKITNDLKKLYHILTDSNALNIYVNLTKLWEEKASECFNLFNNIPYLYSYLYQ